MMSEETLQLLFLNVLVILFIAGMVLLFLGGVAYIAFEIFRCIREYKNDKKQKGVVQK
jgi:hypothetical protein